MRKKSVSSWRVVLIRKKGEYIGTVEAPDAEAAVRAAIKEFEITDPERQKRLAAYRLS